MSYKRCLGLVGRWGRHVVAILCIFLLAAGHIAAATLPQRPDGDHTAVREFETVAQTMPQAAGVGLLDMRHQFWYTAAGALLAVWLLDVALRRLPARTWRTRSEMVLALGGLLWLAGWGWTQTTGWQGHLFVPPHHTVGVGPAQIPTVVFKQFTIPPAPDGPGRSLTMQVQVNGEPATISEQNPLHVQGWVLRPRWYGGIVRFSDETQLYFGGDGTQTTTVDGETVRVTLDVETLDVEIVSPMPATVDRYAVLAATFDPGANVRRLGVVVLFLGGVLWVRIQYRR